MNNDSKLRQVLQFLALDNKQKLSCLPTIPSGKELEIFETSLRTGNPLLIIGYECYDCIDRHKFGADEFSHILSEMECLMDAMITFENGVWMWGLGDPGLSASTHLFWNILRRLSRGALRRRNWPTQIPEIVIEDFITVGRWVPEKQKRKLTSKPRR